MGEPRPSPSGLWQQAGGDAEEYRRLLREHGHLVPGTPEPLPCGWPRADFGEPVSRQCCPMDTYGTDCEGNLRAECSCDSDCDCWCLDCRCRSRWDGEDDD